MTPKVAAQLNNPWVAVKPIGDRLVQARALRRVHEAFHAGQDVAGQLRSVVAQSWNRSGSAGVAPVGHLPPIVMDDRELQDRWSHHPLFPVLPVLRDLLRGAISDSAHMLVISDARGVLMWIEGHQRVVRATEDMHFVCGADWSEAGAGTNALGTAIAVDHPVQIFSAEHFNRAVHPWQCSGAPIHHPETGEILGVLDLTGHLQTAHPHTLGLVTAAAGMAEAYLRHELERRDEALREAYFERIAGAAQATALVRPNGQVLAAVPHGWLSEVVDPPLPGRELRLPDGAVADVEALVQHAHEAAVIWRRRPGVRAGAGLAPAAVRLNLFGFQPSLVRGGVRVPLTARHAEILTALLLAGSGLTAAGLTREVYGDRGKTVTLRAELSRLRRSFPKLIAARPYKFTQPVRSDLDDVRNLLEQERPQEARALLRTGLLPDSTAPCVEAIRESLLSTAAALETGGLPSKRQMRFPESAGLPGHHVTRP